MLNVKTLAAAAAIAALSHSLILPRAPAHPIDCLHNCQIDDRGLALIKHFEGYYPYPYRDPVGIVTIAFGHVVQRGETIKVPIMGSEAEKLLESDANATARHVNRLIMVPLTPAQADAVISFTFNLGSRTLQKSSLRRRINAKQNSKVPPEFLKYDHAGGRVLPGLVARRRAEAQLYAGD